MISEAPLERADGGLAPAEEGWFVLNAREARWLRGEGRGARLAFEGETEFPQLGISLFVLAPGEPMGMYHWEADQEDFLVLSGEALLIIEGQERPLRQWDFIHCPAHTSHIIVGAGDAPCAVLAVGSREHQAGAEWGGYPVDAAALRHGVGVERETNEADEAYARFPAREPTGYREGWLPRIASTRPTEAPDMTGHDRSKLVRDAYRAYETGERRLIERLLTEDFTFYSPADVGIDRTEYFERCWPNAEQIEAFEFERLIESGDEVIVTYESTRADGSRFRNTEVLTFEGDRISRVEVYFGWDLE